VGNLVGMRKTELVIFSKPDDEFLTAGCSSCPDVENQSAMWIVEESTQED
jgi:hypothetical protein